MRFIITHSEQYRNNGRCEMTTLPLPAASLSPQLRFPARQVLLRMANDLIYLALWSIRGAILRAEANFLPALREGGRAAGRGSADGEALLQRELALDAARGEALAGRGEALGGADMEPFAVVHDRAQAARHLGAVEEPDQ